MSGYSRIVKGTSDGQVRRIACRQCAASTNHTVVGSVDHQWGNRDIEGLDRHELVQCMGCDTVTFRLEQSNSEDVWQDTETGELEPAIREELYPARMVGRPPLHDAVLLPPYVRAVYEEVYLAMASGLLTLAAIGMRALVERACVELGAQKWGLEKKLKQMVSLGRLTAEAAASLKPIKDIGDDAAHKGMTLDGSDLIIALGVVEHLLEGAFLMKRRVRQLSHRLELKRDERGKPE